MHEFGLDIHFAYASFKRVFDFSRDYFTQYFEICYPNRFVRRLQDNYFLHKFVENYLFFTGFTTGKVELFLDFNFVQFGLLKDLTKQKYIDQKMHL